MNSSRVKMGADGRITAHVTGAFDFDAARTLLLECKSHPLQTIAGITVHLDGVTHIDSCGIGALSLLQDLVGVERFSLDLANCAPVVRQLFESAILDQFVSPRTLRHCATCFDIAKIDCKVVPLPTMPAQNLLRPAGSVVR
jgi:anti-anti-sigma regulatory factor